jgi:hypothetical protein
MTNTLRYKLFFLFLATGNMLSLTAQTCCSGGIPLSNNIGMALLEKGNLQLGINYDLNHLNTLKVGSKTLDANSRLRITHSLLLNAGYSISDRFAVEGLFTWVNQRRKITQFGNKNLDQTRGVGDAVVLIRYNFPGIFGDQTDWSVGLGSKIPLGSSTEVSDQGITLNADLQPGSNAWDIIYWSSFATPVKSRPSLVLFGRIIYRDTGINSSYLETSSYRFGNEMQTYLGLSDQFLALNTIVVPSLSVKYRHATQDKIDGFRLDNTGGNWINLIPSFSFNINANIVFNATAELPLYSNVDGTQLTPTSRITTGLLFILTPNKQTINLN